MAGHMGYEASACTVEGREQAQREEEMESLKQSREGPLDLGASLQGSGQQG